MPLTLPVIARFSFCWMPADQRRYSATESSSEARNLESPRTGLAVSVTSASKMSSSEGAGSVEQIATECLRSWARWLKARAAETVVLPTPPLPMLKERGVARDGHAAFFNLTASADFFGARVVGSF